MTSLLERSEDFLLMEAKKVAGELGSAALLLGTAVTGTLVSSVQRFFGEFFSPPENTSEEEVIFVGPGFLAPGFAYAGISAFIEWREWMFGRNIRVHVPNIGTTYGNVNCRKFEDTLKRLDDEIAKHHPRFGIGHSLGGILFGAASARHSDFHACAVGSPVWDGTPWIPLQHLARWSLGVDPENPPLHIEELRERIMEHPERITTISSEGDRIAPPDRCHIPGAENIVVEGGFADLHCGLVLSLEVHRHIRRAHRRSFPPVRLVPSIVKSALSIA